MGSGDKEAADYYLWKLMRITTLLSFVWNLFILACLPVILPLYSISEETRRLLIIIVIIHNAFCGTIGAFFGPAAVLFTVIVSSFVGAFAGGILILRGRAKLGGFTAVPYGPFLAFGTVVWMLWGPRIVNWYLHLHAIPR